MSSVNIANATIRIGATAEDVAGAVNSAIGHFTRFSNSVVNSSQTTLGSLRGFAAELTAIFGGIKLTHFGLEAIQTFERAEIAFEVMLKSADKAKTLMRDLQAFEFKTPMKFTEMTGAVQKLLNAQFALEDVPTMLRIIGDAAAASGDSMAFVMERLSRTFGQLKARGWITGEEIRELVHANIAARQYLVEGVSKHLGRDVTAEEVSKMIENKQVSSEVALRSILTGMEKNTKGLMERVGTETYEGIFKRVASQTELIATDLGKSFDKAFDLKKYLNTWVQFMVDLRHSARDFGQALKENLAFQLITKGFQILKEVVVETFSIIRYAVGDSLGDFRKFGKELARMEIDVYKIRDAVLNSAEAITAGYYRVADALHLMFVTTGKKIAKTIFDLNITVMENWPKFLLTKEAEENRKKQLFSARIASNMLGRSIDRDVGIDAHRDEMLRLRAFFDKLREGNRLDEKINKNTVAQFGRTLYDNVVKPWFDGSVALSKFSKSIDSLTSLKSKVDFSEMVKHIEEMNTAIEKEARTPLEKLKDDIADLEDAFMFREIDAATYEKGLGNILRKAGGQPDKLNETRLADALVAGSAEAQRVSAEARMQQQERIPNLLDQIRKESEKQVKLTQDLLKAAQQGGLILVGVP